jgi:hypothetical protein
MVSPRAVDRNANLGAHTSDPRPDVTVVSTPSPAHHRRHTYADLAAANIAGLPVPLVFTSATTATRLCEGHFIRDMRTQ